MPAVLGSLVPFGVDPATTARYLYPALLGVNLALIGRLGLLALGAKRWVWVVGVQLCLLLGALDGFRRFPFLVVHTTLLSEPIMLAFGLASVLCAVLYRQRGDPRLFWIAALLASAATLCRFAGAANVLTVAVVALAVRADPWRPRLVRAAAALAIGIVPTAVVTLASSARLGRQARASEAMELGKIPGEMASGFSTIIWPPSWSTSTRFAVGGTILLVAAINVLWRLLVSRPQDEGAAESTAPALWVLGAFSICYSITLVGARGFTDRNIPLDGRMLDGVLGPLLILLAAALASASLRSVRGLAGVGAGLLVVGVLAVPGLDSLPNAIERGNRPSVEHLASQAEFGAALDAAPEGLPAFSNIPDGVYLVGERPTYMVPCEFDYFRHQSKSDFDQQVADLIRVVREGRAILVLAPGRIRRGCLSGDDPPAGLHEISRWPAGVVYGRP